MEKTEDLWIGKVYWRKKGAPFKAINLYDSALTLEDQDSVT